MPLMFTDEMRERLRVALKQKGFLKKDWPDLCRSAGLQRSYLWTIFHKQRGGLELVKKICDEIGVNINWIETGVGTPDIKLHQRGPRHLNADLILVALQTIMGSAFSLDDAESSYAAREILSLVEHPPNGSSAIDISDKVRMGILGALRRYERRQ